MRAERVFGYVGLGFFFLFPLVSLLQLRDSDDAWRQAAHRARPSVLTLHSAAEVGSAVSPGPVACGVVLCRDPLRVAVVESPGGRRLESVTAAGRIVWDTVLEDLKGGFAILQAREPGASPDLGAIATAAGAASASARAQMLAAATDALQAGDDSTEGVTAALVPPSELAPMPIWVGVLTPGPSAGRRAYTASVLRPVLDPGAISAANAADSTHIDPVLAGAPFVDRRGAVVALYAGRGVRGPEAIPIAAVREAMHALERRAGS